MPKSTKRMSLLFALTMSVALAATACAPTAPTDPGADPTGGTTNGASAELEKVVLAVPNATFFTSGLPYHVGVDQGIYEKHGLDVEMTVTSGGAGSVQAVATGSADMSVDSGAPAVIAAYAEGGPVRAVGSSAKGLALVWFADAAGPIKTLEDLSGEKIGFSSNGSSSQLGTFAINEALALKGLPPAEAVAIGGISDQYTAVMTGQIAAGFTEPPSLMHEVDAGELTIVANITELDNYADYQDVVVRMATANAQFLKENPETVRAFTEAHSEAWDWIFANPEEAVDIWIRDADLKEPKETLMTVFDYFTVEDLKMSPMGDVDKVLEVSLETGFIKEPLTDEQVEELVGFAQQ